MAVMAFGASLPRCCCKADEGYNLKTYTCYSLFKTRPNFPNFPANFPASRILPVRFLSYQILRPAFFARRFSYFPMVQKAVIAFMIENYVIEKFDSQCFTGGF